MGIIKVLLMQCEKLPGGNTPGEGWGLCLYCHALLCVLPAKVTLRAKTNLLVHFMPATLPKYPQDALNTGKVIFSAYFGKLNRDPFSFHGRSKYPTYCALLPAGNEPGSYVLSHVCKRESYWICCLSL